MLTGKKVTLKESVIKWYLDHPEIYVRGDGMLDFSYEEETKVLLLMGLGEMVVGTVSHPGNDCWYVVFKTELGTLQEYFECRHLTLI